MIFLDMYTQHVWFTLNPFYYLGKSNNKICDEIKNNCNCGGNNNEVDITKAHLEIRT